MVTTQKTSVHVGTVTLLKDYVIRGPYSWTQFTATLPAGPLRRVDIATYEPASFTFTIGRNPRQVDNWGRPKIKIVIDSLDPAILTAKFSATEKYRLDGAEVLITKCLSLDNEGFRRELLYSGVSKGTISLEYREFQNDLARPAFSQELKYDLAEGDEIGFRGSRFKILKATNSSVKYVVMKPLE